MDLQIGDIVFVKGGGLIGKLISLLTNSPYTHVAVVYDIEGDGTVLIMDTDWIHTKLRLLRYYDDRGYDTYRYIKGLSDRQKHMVQQWILRHLDIDYDYIQLFSFINRLVFNINRVFNSPDKFVCSEMVDRLYYEKLDIDLRPRYHIGNVTPEDLRQSSLLYKVVPTTLTTS